MFVPVSGILGGRRDARPFVPITARKIPETLNGGCGGSVAFLLVLIVGKLRVLEVRLSPTCLRQKLQGSPSVGYVITAAQATKDLFERGEYYSVIARGSDVYRYH